MENYGSYPLDGIGQHIYIDQGKLTTSDRIRQYEDWVRQAYTKYEGTGTTKKIFITEIGWTTQSVSREIQDQNLRIAFQTIEATPYVQLAIWFRWQDVLNPRLLYGVLDSSGNLKQSYAGYQFYQTYEGRYPNHTTHDDILTYYNNVGQAVLGNPYDNGSSPWVHAWGKGYAQDFDGGSNGKLMVMSSADGTYEVNDVHGLLDFYLSYDGLHLYGYPVNDEYDFDDGSRQDFQNGYLTWDPVNGVVGHCRL